MTFSPTAVLWLGRIYFLISVALWPLTTIISTAAAIKIKIPPLRALRRASVHAASAR